MSPDILLKQFALVQHSAPELDKRSRPHLKACNDSWREEETSIKVKNVWMYLSRAVDSEGNTLEFLLSPTRDAQAAKRFFEKALHATAGSASRACPTDEKEARLLVPLSLQLVLRHQGRVLWEPHQPLSRLRAAPRSVPRVMNVDKNAAYPKAIADLKAAGTLPEHVELKPGQILE